MKPFRLFSQVLLLLGLVMVCAAGSSKAAMQIDIYGPGQNIVNLAMAAPLSTGQPAQGLGKELDAAIHDNLSFLPFMRLTDPKAVLGGTTLPGYQPPERRLQALPACGRGPARHRRLASGRQVRVHSGAARL